VRNLQFYPGKTANWKGLKKGLKKRAQEVQREKALRPSIEFLEPDVTTPLLKRTRKGRVRKGRGAMVQKRKKVTRAKTRREGKRARSGGRFS